MHVLKLHQTHNAFGKTEGWQIIKNRKKKSTSQYTGHKWNLFNITAVVIHVFYIFGDLETGHKSVQNMLRRFKSARGRCKNCFKQCHHKQSSRSEWV